MTLTSKAGDGRPCTIRHAKKQRELPFVICSERGSRTSMQSWARDHRGLVDGALADHGAVLLRGFGGLNPADLAGVTEVLAGPPLEYLQRSTPRKRVAGNIFTSTEYPATEAIPIHNELSYSCNWVNRLLFYCVRPATEGGQTPLADSCNVLKRIPPAIRSLFRDRGLRYVRHYYPHLDVPWQDAFQTADRVAVSAQCHRMGMQAQWLSDDVLRTVDVRPATILHPISAEEAWFNQAHLFHPSALGEDLRGALLSMFSSQQLPRNVFLGDGTEIDDSVLATIREAYAAEERTFSWGAGDLLLVDNVRVAHGRKPFVGPREVLVSMASPGAQFSE